jgi:hypothetical protein
MKTITADNRRDLIKNLVAMHAIQQRVQPIQNEYSKGFPFK